MSELGGRETLLRLRQGYHVTMEKKGESLEVMAVPRCQTCRHWGCAGVVDLGGGKLRMNTGYCDRLAIVCAPEFGCASWEAEE